MVAYVFAGDLRPTLQKIIEVCEGKGECLISSSLKHPHYLLFQIIGAKFIVFAEFEVCENFSTSIPISDFAKLLKALDGLPAEDVLEFASIDEGEA
jgi:hypothetical protein